MGFYGTILNTFYDIVLQSSVEEYSFGKETLTIVILWVGQHGERGK